MMGLQEFERLRNATASSESEKEELRQQLQALAGKNRDEKNRMEQLLEGVIHGQQGELEKQKMEFDDLQARQTESLNGCRDDVEAVPTVARVCLWNTFNVPDLAPPSPIKQLLTGA